MVWCRSAVLSLSFFCAGRGRAAASAPRARSLMAAHRLRDITAEPSKEALAHLRAAIAVRALTAGPSTGSSSSLVPRTSVVTMASKPPTSAAPALGPLLRSTMR